MKYLRNPRSGKIVCVEDNVTVTQPSSVQVVWHRPDGTEQIITNPDVESELIAQGQKVSVRPQGEVEFEAVTQAEYMAQLDNMVAGIEGSSG